MQIALALGMTIVSACCLNLCYLLEHSVASRLPALSLRQPVASLRSLLGNRRWLTGFGAEAGGWILYVGALALAPRSLVPSGGCPARTTGSTRSARAEEGLLLRTGPRAV